MRQSVLTHGQDPETTLTAARTAAVTENLLRRTAGEVLNDATVFTHGVSHYLSQAAHESEGRFLPECSEELVKPTMSANRTRRHHDSLRCAYCQLEGPSS